ncbi:hypothetical protein VTJ49DRAFT_1780 [Mycothermus thermophilus]|uniref:Uncharacterized protein n=1 Tax=Humicola insolens TaxID=85995 RepID=A0ABR3VDI4_HUMIN
MAGSALQPDTHNALDPAINTAYHGVQAEAQAASSSTHGNEVAPQRSAACQRALNVIYPFVGKSNATRPLQTGASNGNCGVRCRPSHFRPSRSATLLRSCTSTTRLGRMKCCEVLGRDSQLCVSPSAMHVHARGRVMAWRCPVCPLLTFTSLTVSSGRVQ